MSARRSPIADSMSLIDSIVSFKAAESLAQVQMAVAAKVLQTTRDQGQMVVELLNAALEGMEQAIVDLASDLGTNLDTYG